MKDKVQIVKDLVYWLVEEYGNIEGSDLWRLSARMIQFDETPDDLLPEGGYAQLVRGIFNKCKPDLRLNETVLSIDYSQDIVKIETNKGAHYAKKIISSLPLGVLQHKQVQLIPEIPREYQKSINLLDASVH